MHVILKIMNVVSGCIITLVYCRLILCMTILCPETVLNICPCIARVQNGYVADQENHGVVAILRLAKIKTYLGKYHLYHILKLYINGEAFCCLLK
jgi:hypothetical protein